MTVLLRLTVLVILVTTAVSEHGQLFCPLGTRIISTDTGCDVCLCCSGADTNDYLVRCDQRNLTRVPALPTNVTTLWLFGNNIKPVDIHQRLPLMRKLKLSHCRTSDQLRHHHCQEEPTSLGKWFWTRLPSLEELDIYTDPTTDESFQHADKRLEVMTLACKEKLLERSQYDLFSTLSVGTLVVYNCGLRPDIKILPNIDRLVVKEDSTAITHINLPHTHVQLSLRQDSSAQCLTLSRVLVKSLDVVCTTDVLNITNDMFGDVTGVNKLSLTIEAHQPGYVLTSGLQQMKIDSLTLKLGFVDTYYMRIIFWVLRNVEIKELKLVLIPNKSVMDGSHLSRHHTVKFGYLLHEMKWLSRLWPNVDDFLHEVESSRVKNVVLSAIGEIMNVNHTDSKLFHRLEGLIFNAIGASLLHRGGHPRLKRHIHFNIGKKIKTAIQHLTTEKSKFEKKIKKEIRHLTAKNIGEEMKNRAQQFIEKKLVGQYMNRASVAMGNLNGKDIKTISDKLGPKFDKDELVQALNYIPTPTVGMNKWIGARNYVDPLYVVGKTANKIREFDCEGCEIDASLDNIEMPSLERLRLSTHTRLFLHIDSLSTEAPKLESIQLNRLYQLHFGEFSLQNDNLKHLDLSYNWNLKYGFMKMNFSKLVNLRTLKLDATFKNISICDQASLYSLPEEEHGFSITNLDKLEILSIANNNAKFLGVPSDILLGLTNLLELNLAGNQLGLLPSNKLKDLVSKTSTKLRILDMSYNGITTIDDETFHNMNDLRTVKLNGNQITIISLDLFKNNPLISSMDIGNNNIVKIEPTIPEHMSYLRVFKYDNNSFQCDCELRGFRDWIQQNRDGIMMNSTESCYDNLAHHYDTTQTVMDFSVSWLACDHHFTTLILITVSAAVMILAGLIYCLYYHRYDLTYVYFLRSRRRRGYDQLRNDDFEYDAFLCYCEKDCEIAYEIHRRLEGKKKVEDQTTTSCNGQQDGQIAYEMQKRRENNDEQSADESEDVEDDARFRVVIHGRDFTPGWSISENIAHYVKRSRKFIPLISRTFLQSEWAQYELEMAKYRSFKEKRNMLIPVFIESIPKGEIPDSLAALKRRIVYLDWPGDRKRQKSIFFKRLKMSLDWQRQEPGVFASAV